jgi:hypothetical protein
LTTKSKEIKEMRNLKTLGLAVLTLALWNSGTSRAAQNGAPSGGYTQTCQDIRTNGSTLEARCQTRDGNWNRTSLQEFNRCTGQVENDDGRLVCNKEGNNGQGYGQGNGQGYRRDGGPERRDGVPSGGYAQTCRDIRTNGNALEATCDTGSGTWTRTSLPDFNQCTSGIENINGRLQCTRQNYERNNGQDNNQGYRRDGGPERRDNDVPEGDYAQTCRNIRTSGSTLLATCQQRNGRWRPASLREFNQCTSEIENSNGRLMCSR